MKKEREVLDMKAKKEMERREIEVNKHELYIESNIAPSFKPKTHRW